MFRRAKVSAQAEVTAWTRLELAYADVEEAERELAAALDAVIDLGDRQRRTAEAAQHPANASRTQRRDEVRS